jgi:orotate phosphoribosyltransferase-like protein
LSDIFNERGVMSKKELTVERYEEIKRLLDLGISGRKIAKSLNCSRNTVKGIAAGEVKDPSIPKDLKDPIWTEQIYWDEVLKLFNQGHYLKYIWEEKAFSITSYVNFWRQFAKRFP